MECHETLLPVKYQAFQTGVRLQFEVVIKNSQKGDEVAVSLLGDVI
jgi:hypothetical protein